MGKKLLILFIFPVLLLALSCATVPLTERKTLSLVPETQMLSLSSQQYHELLEQTKVSTDPVKTAMVQRVGKNIATAAEEFMRDAGRSRDVKDFRWEFNLLDDNTVNAFCMPGGKVGVYTGILPITQDETGLAVVVGHEVAHAIARHGNERMSQALVAQMGGIGLDLALSQQSAATRSIFLNLYGIGSNIGFILPYSRIQENEADRIGLALMAKAGYDPHAAVPLWERMNKEGGPRPPEFLSTHPAPESRIRNIQGLIPEAMKYYKKQG
ncbi:MAG: M48 family metallopeptidase [Syntrophales bacterium]|nr:M48 family metallopeptidase [Syntrophales bacterium]MDD5233008.1 M48 family metallopeptidase [Syntrophales bacterium]